MGASMQEIYKIFPGSWDKYIPVSDFLAKRKPRLSKYHVYFTVSVLHILGGGGFFRDKGADGFDIGAAAYTVCAFLSCGNNFREGQGDISAAKGEIFVTQEEISVTQEGQEEIFLTQGEIFNTGGNSQHTVDEEGTNRQTRTCCSFRNCVKSCVW